MRSDRTLLRWYRVINRKFFDSVLPDDVCVRWANTAEEKEKKWEAAYFGWCEDAKGRHKYQIVLSRKNNRKMSAKLSTLAHECIHIATALRDDHGPVFEQWRQHISDRGIFKKHALRRNLTIF